MSEASISGEEGKCMWCGLTRIYHMPSSAGVECSIPGKVFTPEAPTSKTGSCPFCHRPAEVGIGIFHEPHCIALESAGINRMQHHLLTTEIERLKASAWDCRSALRRFEMDVREEVRNGGMTQASRTTLARCADRADEAEKTAMKSLSGETAP